MILQKIRIPYDIDRGVYLQDNLNIDFSIDDANSCQLIIPVGREPFIRSGARGIKDTEFREPLDLTGYSAIAYFMHKDFDLQYPLDVEGNQLSLILPTEVLAYKGRVDVQIIIYKAETNFKKAGLKFYYNVEKSYEGDFLEANNGNTIITMFRAELNYLEKRVTTLEENGGSGNSGSVELPTDLVRYIISTNEPTDEELQEGMTIWFEEEV